jgi:hypothetical protein
VYGYSGNLYGWEFGHGMGRFAIPVERFLGASNAYKRREMHIDLFSDLVGKCTFVPRVALLVDIGSGP